MSNLTTAQRLSAYREELCAAGFSDHEAGQLVESAAPSLIEDVEVQADLDDTTPSIGEVRIHLRPEWDEGDLRRVVEHVQGTVEKAAQR
ncbi:hypothetical protein GCM10023085_45590 [Actinomadura viridis]|uniref:Uncharacterized protein n=1 Tax=Actinomadura viridis TaxID=58110 RepID=A0A931DJK8_9ACTN|nr:hypothetical protein [Actinomadura viridis]MBG6089919.1 hypothetical protein [Actinomadura viridis]